ncbi:CopG family transcriptional regulator, partial [Coleofasciculus sp. FACHB-712]|nr:CopG family transcriptional regulator [Coleofasciculus sp. FACHB-712]
MQKVTISLEDDILRFVDRQAKGNRSAYIND